MRYISLALFAEGQSDQEFLQRIIYRAVHEVASGLDGQAFEVQEAFVKGAAYQRGDTRQRRICTAFERLMASGAITLLFIHADADGDELIARNERILPASELLAKSLGDDLAYGIVGIVLVRMTEAWALADRDALAAEMGTSDPLEEFLGGAGPGAVERLPDPKQVLARVLQTGQRSNRQRSGDRPIPASLGDRISLACLRQVPAFRVFERELQANLRKAWKMP